MTFNGLYLSIIVNEKRHVIKMDYMVYLLNYKTAHTIVEDYLKYGI